MKNWKCASELSLLNIMEMIHIFSHLSVKPYTFPNGYFYTLWSASMSTVSFNSDFDHSWTGHYWSLFAPNFSKSTYRPVMEPINFINAFQTSLLDHKLSSSDSLLCWLEEQPNFFISRYLRFLFQKDRNITN